MSSFSQKQVEAVAQVIYEQWNDHPKYVPWIPHGNTLMQVKARGLAAAALSTVTLELPKRREEAQDSQNEMRVYQHGVAKGYNQCLDDIGTLVNCYV